MPVVPQGGMDGTGVYALILASVSAPDGHFRLHLITQTWGEVMSSGEKEGKREGQCFPDKWPTSILTFLSWTYSHSEEGRRLWGQVRRQHIVPLCEWVSGLESHRALLPSPPKGKVPKSL